MENAGREELSGQKRYLSPFSAWSLSFGCAVGWGCFVMPGTTFLPSAGPMGTVLGMLLGAVVMVLIGLNYHYLMNRYPGSGGALTFTIKAFGYDHGFLSAWFLILVYMAITWANASAVALIARQLFGSFFSFGFHYQLLGYDVYGGEALLSLVVIILAALICIRGRSLARMLQGVLASMLILGIVICFAMVFLKRGQGFGGYAPAFSPWAGNPLSQVLTIIVLSPWAYVGFESISQSASRLSFPIKKTIWIFVAALAAGASAYVLVSLIAASLQPPEYQSWADYVGDLGNLTGTKSLPVFYAVHELGGKLGMTVLGLTVLSAILTGIIGNSIAAGRLIASMAKEGIMPEWFGRLNEEGSPRNALIVLMAASLLAPFLGRTAIGWIVDVNTIGAIIVYGYVSGAAYVTARAEEGKKRYRNTGIAGLVISVIFFLYFMAFSVGAMATESYLILAIWGILGFVYFRYIFGRDREHRFGRSTVVWLGLLFLIFFTTLLWVRKATDDMTKSVVESISKFYEEKNPLENQETIDATEAYLAFQMEEANRLLTRNSIIQMGIIIAGLAIMFSIYSIISRREKEMELEKLKAQERSRAKSAFLSNMSHDIRTPMNAIVGYTSLAKRDDASLEEIRGYLDKIEGSSQHLLALINDVLEMSRIESGKMELELVAADLRKMMESIGDVFSTQMEQKKIRFTVDVDSLPQSRVYCDKNRLNRVLLNLISNAYKFTPEGGTVQVSVRQTEEEAEKARYEIRVRDSGIGMTEEFAAKVFEAFERERNATVSGIQGTGLGMAITKSMVDLMGGTIEVHTAPGQGTEFVIRLWLDLEEGALEEGQEEQPEEKKLSADFSKMRLLLAEDMEINREIASMLLNGLGFTVETAENGREAVEKVAASAPGYYDAVLMDVQMPVMDGYEAVRQIRRLADPGLSSIPVIAMTANAFAEDVKKAGEAGMDAHIAKPIDVNVMANTLQEVLGHGT